MKRIPNIPPTFTTSTLFRILTAILLFTACSEEPIGTNTPVIESDGTYRAHLSVELPNVPVIPASLGRAGTAASYYGELPDENSVSDMWILQFDMNIDGGTLVMADYRTDFIVTGRRFSLDTKLIADDRQKLILIANTHNSSMFSATEASGFKLTDLENKQFTQDLYNLTAETKLPMMGHTEQTAFGESDMVTVSLTYATAKIVVAYNLLRLPPGESFTPTSIQLLQVPKTVSMNSPDRGADYPVNLSAETFTDYPPVTITDGTPSRFVWYMLTNQRGTDTQTYPTKKTGRADVEAYCTYVKLSGTYKNSIDDAGKTVHYRLWLGANNTNDYNITAGTLYEVTICPLGISTEDSRIEIEAGE